MEAAPEQYTEPSKRRKTKIEKKWEHLDIEHLIGQAEMHPCLWDASSKDHKNRNRRANSWEEIALTFEGRYTAIDCSTKWQCLRATHRNVCSQLKKNKSGQAATTQPIWRYYNAMSYITAAESSFKTMSVSNMPDNDDSSNILVEEQTPTAQADFGKTDSKTANIGQRKLKSKSVNSAAADDTRALATKALEMVVERMDANSAHDSAQIFGNFIASQLRGINNDRSKRIQKKITRVMFDMLDEYETQDSVELNASSISTNQAATENPDLSINEFIIIDTSTSN